MIRRIPWGSRLVRFGLSGGVVALVYVSLMTVLVLAGVQTQVALPIAYGLAVTLHFTLNRHFVFRSHHGYLHGLTAQGSRYLVVALTSYGLTALSLAVLPSALGAPKLAVYYATAAALALLSFACLRRFVFLSSAPVSVEPRAGA